MEHEKKRRLGKYICELFDCQYCGLSRIDGMPIVSLHDRDIVQKLQKRGIVVEMISTMEDHLYNKSKGPIGSADDDVYEPVVIDMTTMRNSRSIVIKLHNIEIFERQIKIKQILDKYE